MNCAQTTLKKLQDYIESLDEAEYTYGELLDALYEYIQLGLLPVTEK